MANIPAMPREIISSLTRWQALRKSNWSTAVAAEVFNGLLGAAKSAESRAITA